MRKLVFLFLFWLFVGCENQFLKDNSSNPEYVFESFWYELNRNYSFFSYMNLNWDSVYSSYRPLVMPGTTDDELFRIFGDILNLLNDAHTNVYTPMGIAGNTDYFEKYPINQIDSDQPYFKYYQSNNRIFEFGELASSNLGYVKIKTFDGEHDNFEKFDSIINSFKSSLGLIIDVRSNRGGKISNSELIIKSIADSLRFICKYRIRNGPSHENFSDWINYYTKFSETNAYYKKPIAILTNRQSFSATEWFVLSAGILPNVTIVGDTTGGGSAFPIIQELPNGWLLRISNTQTVLPSGRDFQFTGLYPDIPIWINANDASRNIDTILEKAISVLAGD